MTHSLASFNNVISLSNHPSSLSQKSDEVMERSSKESLRGEESRQSIFGTLDHIGSQRVNETAFLKHKERLEDRNSNYSIQEGLHNQSSEDVNRHFEGEEVARLKFLIGEKDNCIRDMTQRLKMVMEQLERWEIESKANQCFSRLMGDLSRMFQIPDISIEDIRIQVSTLLE